MAPVNPLTGPGVGHGRRWLAVITFRLAGQLPRMAMELNRRHAMPISRAKIRWSLSGAIGCRPDRGRHESEGLARDPDRIHQRDRPPRSSVLALPPRPSRRQASETILQLGCPTRLQPWRPRPMPRARSGTLEFPQSTFWGESNLKYGGSTGQLNRSESRSVRNAEFARLSNVHQRSFATPKPRAGVRCHQDLRLPENPSARRADWLG